MALDRAEILKKLGRWNVSSLPSCQELLNLAFVDANATSIRLKTWDSDSTAHLWSIRNQRGGLVPEAVTKIEKLPADPKTPLVDSWKYTFTAASSISNKPTCTVKVTYTTAAKTEIASIERTNP